MPPITARAAVVDEIGRVTVRSLQISEPKEGEILVKLVATGLCHTDLAMIQGNLSVPLPFVPGHEGAGVVEVVGPGVNDLSPGDHVICSVVARCGHCYTCVRNRNPCQTASRAAFTGVMLDNTQRLHDGDQAVNHIFCQSSFAEYAVVPAVSAAKVRLDAPLEKLAPLGCSVGTGLGVVINKARVTPGSSVLVMGLGGVGLAALLGARAVGAGLVICADISAAKLDKASALGADAVLNVSEGDVVQAVVDLTGGQGVDYAIDAVGAEGTLGQCFKATSAGGTTVAVGAMHESLTTSIDTLSLLSEKTLTGTYGGSGQPKRDIPTYVDLYMAGRLDVGALVDHYFSLDSFAETVASFEAGEFVRAVLKW